MENKNKEIIERVKNEILKDFKDKIKILNANAPPAWYVNQLRTTLKKLDVLGNLIENAEKHLQKLIQENIKKSINNK